MQRMVCTGALLLALSMAATHGNHSMTAAAQSSLEPGPQDKDAPQEFTLTKSGLLYRVLRKSDGKKPLKTDTVKVHYKGWLDDKTEFDSSYKRREAIEFPLKGVISGWTEGMQYVGEGGMIELEIPSNLGYGDRGFPPIIPPKAKLHFLIELIEVK